MTDFSMQLSAYLDGELTDEQSLAVEQRLASDPEAQAEMEKLLEADNFAKDHFDALLQEPIPFALAQTIKSASVEAEPVAIKTTPVKAKSPMWQSMAASFVMLAVGATGGYIIHDKIGTTTPVVVAKAGWLTEIASYHAVYANQKKHLVEVAATETKHIEKWLGKTIGANFSVPDLTALDLKFEGARLLVAAGKPVAQLLYTQSDGTVIALCLLKKSMKQPAKQTDGSFAKAVFKKTTINKFDFVSWNAGNAGYVIVGPGGKSNLQQIAELAAKNV